MFTLAHLSDPHIPPLPECSPFELIGKRITGYLNWRWRRGAHHSREVLDKLTKDMLAHEPDHIAVTGDLANLSLAPEFQTGREFLQSLGDGKRVSVIPGNHDAYVRLHPKAGTHHWLPYMESNAAGERLFPTPPTQFPFVRRFGDVALVALSSAVPTMPLIAAGKIGSLQRDLLGSALDRLKQANLFRVVLIHHPPLREQAGWHRGLRDAGKFKRVLQRHGAELILHGHNHEQTVLEIPTATGPAIIVGVPSASEAVEGRAPAARYNQYAIARNGDGWRVEMVGRSVAAPPEHVWESERRILRDG